MGGPDCIQPREQCSEQLREAAPIYECNDNILETPSAGGAGSTTLCSAGAGGPPGLRRLPRGPPRSNDIRLIDWPNCEDLRRSRRDAVPKGTHGGVKTRRRSRRQGSKQWTIATRHTHGQGLTAQGGTSSGRPRYQTRVQCRRGVMRAQDSSTRGVFMCSRDVQSNTPKERR